MDDESIAQRPEARWALWAGIGGALLVAGLAVSGIVASPGLDGVLGFIFVPLVAAVAAVPAGIWGLALGHVVLRMQGRVEGPVQLFWAAVAAASTLPLAACFALWLR